MVIFYSNFNLRILHASLLPIINEESNSSECESIDEISKQEIEDHKNNLKSKLTGVNYETYIKQFWVGAQIKKTPKDSLIKFNTIKTSSSFFRKYLYFSTRKISYKSNNTCTDIVVWGQNLHSDLSGRKLTQMELKMIEFPQYIRDIIVGLLLSDAWLSYASKKHKNPRLGFEQSSSKYEYIWGVFWSLSPYCSSFPRYISRVRWGVKNTTIVFTTRSLPCMEEFYNLFYLKGKKVIPENIYHLLTPEALAHLIMGDGSARLEGGLVICTDSFSMFEVVRIINVLIIRYRLNCKLRKHGPLYHRIYISQHSMVQLRIIIQPFMLPSMIYKIS